MRVRVTIDDEMLTTAKEYFGVDDTSLVLNMALKALVAHEAARRLALLGGSQPDLEDIPRRRPWDEEEE